MGTVSALWRSSHPGPTLVVTALAVILGVSAGVEPSRLALLASAVLAGQLSVGWSNDAVDAARDRAVGRSDKPIARGEVSRAVVWTSAVLAVAVAVALSAVLGIGMLVVHVVAIASAWTYNLGLKNSPASVAPFVVSFGLFPSLATLSALPPDLAAPWAWVAGAALGVGVHLTNVLPDLDDDAATGIRGLPHRMGRRASAVVAFSAVEVGAVAVLIGPLVAGGAIAVPGWIGFAVVSALSAVGLVRALGRADRVVFRLVMAAALALALQLAVTGVAPR